jgi:arylsulfatase
MHPDEPQFGSQPRQTRDGYPVRQGIGVMPGGPDTYVAYGRGWASVSVTPFREFKHWTHEGGISTPLIVHWPMGIPSSRNGGLVRQPGQLPDIMATCLDVAHATYPSHFKGQPITPAEGASLRPAFLGKPIARRTPLVWEHEGNRALRSGKWKIVSRENRPWELYDVEADRPESHDLASQHPRRVTDMARQWEDWAARAHVLPLGAWRGK